MGILSLELPAPYPLALVEAIGLCAGGLWRRLLRNRLLVPLVLMLPACAGAPHRPSLSAATLPGPVTYEARSWGQIALRWQVNPDGTGEIWRRAEQKDAADIRKFHLRLSEPALQSFAADIERAHQATRNGIPCKKTIFDLPYGSVTWDYPQAKQVYAFDTGCRSPAGDAAMELIEAADSTLEKMASIDAEPYIIEPSGPR